MPKRHGESARHPLRLPAIANLSRGLASSTGWGLARFDANGQPLEGLPQFPSITACPCSPTGIRSDISACFLGGFLGDDDFPAPTSLLVSLAELIGGWIAALELAKDSDNELSSLIEITRLLTSSVDLGRILEIVCEAATRATDARSAVLWLLDESRSRLQVVAAFPRDSRLAELPAIDVEKSPLDLDALGGDPVVVHDLTADARVDAWPSQAWHGSRTAMVVGLIGRDGPLGTMHLYSQDQTEFSVHAFQLLTAIANQAATSIEQSALLDDIRAKERLARELAAASEIQAALLPRAIPTFPGIEFAVHFAPCRDVGGDLYDIIPIDKQNIGLAIGDASGKSVTGALMMAMVRGGLHAYVEDIYHISEIVRRLNRSVHKATSGEHFMTLFYGVLNLANSELTYTNAGHNAPLWFHRGRCSELAGGGIVLGADPHCDYHISRVQLIPGDVMVFYTDGLSEMMSHSDELYQKRRIREAVRPVAKKSAREILDAILHDASQFRGEVPPRDDLTVIVMRVG
ncbi:MAG: GAF domain-containing SpoIIE family protein phosphatase [Planctomycetota bacterium]